MSEPSQSRLFFVLVLSASLTWFTFSDIKKERHPDPNASSPRYRSFILGCYLPLYVLLLALIDTLFFGFQYAARHLIYAYFGTFLHIGVYYVILLGLSPWLRRRITARTCALLWMIPNYLYFSRTRSSYLNPDEPLLVIEAPGNTAWILFSVWCAGFLAVLLWKTAEHLLFRRQVLRHAVPVKDQEILSILETIMDQSGSTYKAPPVFSSPQVSSPMTIGLFKRFTVMVLPCREYSREELELIFRHEYIHIARDDALSKFFLLFCTAMCWFNPILWISMKKCAQDLELSCDETVLLDADEDQRRRYANLLLSTAGDDRGFSTCLASSSEALRYRLKNIVSPGKRTSGVLVTGLIAFCLFMSAGYVTLAYGGMTGEETIYAGIPQEEFSMETIVIMEGEERYNMTPTDPEALHRYLKELELMDFAGKYPFPEIDSCVEIWLEAPGRRVVVSLFDNYVRTIGLGLGGTTIDYYLPDGVDWTYLNQILVPVE